MRSVRGAGSSVRDIWLGAADVQAFRGEQGGVECVDGGEYRRSGAALRIAVISDDDIPLARGLASRRRVAQDSRASRRDQVLSGGPYGRGHGRAHKRNERQARPRGMI